MHPDTQNDNPFPGRLAGGLAMIVGPLLVLTGTLLRSPYPFFFPDQLAAAGERPGLMVAAYSCFLAGTVLLWPAVVALAGMIGRTRPVLARWAGCLVVFGLFERTFHAGVDHLAFQLVTHRGVATATAVVAESYSGFHVFHYLSFTIMFGWYVLAFAAWRSGVLGRVRSVALALMGLLPLGVLKGTEIVSIVGTVGLCVALVPAGWALLAAAPRPSRRAVQWSLIAVPAVAGLCLLSSLG